MTCTSAGESSDTAKACSGGDLQRASEVRSPSDQPRSVPTPRISLPFLCSSISQCGPLRGTKLKLLPEEAKEPSRFGPAVGLGLPYHCLGCLLNVNLRSTMSKYLALTMALLSDLLIL